MKKMIFLVLVAMSFTSFATSMNILKKDIQLKVAEVSVETTCLEVSDMDPDTDVSYDCKVGTIHSNIKKQFNNVSSIQPMNHQSSHVMTNLVDDEGSYTVKLRVLYY